VRAALSSTALARVSSWRRIAVRMEPLANKQVDLAKVDQPHIDGDFLALVDVSHSAPSCLLLGRVSPSHGMVEGVATSETGPD
jgi:hypothetical protein